MENSLIVIVIQIVIVVGIIGIVTFFIRLNETVKIEMQLDNVVKSNEKIVDEGLKIYQYRNK